MKNLRFDELLIMSRPERAARRIAFHPDATVLRGPNDTGKSSLIKSIYATLGADVPNMHPRWKAARPVSSLKFSIDDVRFRMIRDGSRFMLFTSDDHLIGSYTNITHDLAPVVSDLFEFRLKLRDHQDREVQATPAFLFLPFYVDQDAGWTTKLASFDRLRQFRSPGLDVLNFHFGIRPSEYYEAKAQANAADAEAQPIRQERASLESVMRRMLENMRDTDFSFSIEDYREQIRVLLERCNALRAEEEVFRNRMAEAFTKLSAIRDQIQITSYALQELRADRDFASGLQGHAVQCPTCHASYENGFAERFAIAVDEDRCIGLLAELDEQRRSAEQAYSAAKSDTKRSKEFIDQIESLLNARRSELALRDVVRSEGHREMRHVVQGQVRELNERIGELDAIRQAAKEAMKVYEDRELKRRIEGFFFAEQSRLFQRLEVRNVPQAAVKRLDAKIQETGSDLPRALLGFYLASVRTIARHSTCILAPLVVDSPRQQDQDEGSWQKIRDVIKEERPAGTQLILGLVDDGNTDFGGSLIALDRKDQVLRTEEYSAAEAELRPLIEAALSEEMRLNDADE